jgi:Helix-turn-helix domain
MTKRIIDKRVKEKFIMDDAYLNGQAKICGWQATLVYNSLCRHANIDQESFPSIRLIMEELGIGRNTTLKGLENLEKYNVIKIEKARAENGKWINNTYTLLDKSVWVKTGGEPKSRRGNYQKKHPQVPDKDTVSRVPLMTQPSPSYDKNQVPVRDTKETHRKETHIKDIPTAKAVDSKNQIFEVFYKTINPTINFANSVYRKACETLIEKLGLEKSITAAKYAVSIQNQKYAPVITNPLQLSNKYGELQAFYAKNHKINQKSKHLIL